VRLRFISSTPQNILEGSGTYAGISTLAKALVEAGVGIEMAAPRRAFPILTAQRIWFNRRLRPPAGVDADVGFDLDGYTVARRSAVPHIASIKGVIADEMRHESGLTRALLAVQAAREGLHVRRASHVVTTSRYAAARLRELYGIPEVHGIVPELIDLAAWRRLLERQSGPPAERFTVLSVCRFYPRKRIHLLLKAAALLRSRIPGLEVRIAGGGPEQPRLRRLWERLGLQPVVRWLGNVTQEELAREYARTSVFCLPSVQEGFGIVFLEAMAAGKPIVAARAAAVPEVVREGVLVEPDDAEALALGIEWLYRQPDMRAALGEAGRRIVREFDAPRVARRFLEEVKTAVQRFGAGMADPRFMDPPPSLT
jgi:glycosyltransferase involved in cell wall biosynthesis